MSNAPNLPAHVGLCQCDECSVQVPSDAELCVPCRAAGCEVEGGPCKADPVEVEMFRHRTSQAGLELDAYDFTATAQASGQVLFQKQVEGHTVRVVVAGGEYGPDNLFDEVDVITERDSDGDVTPAQRFESLSTYLSTLPLPRRSRKAAP